MRKKVKKMKKIRVKFRDKYFKRKVPYFNYDEFNKISELVLALLNIDIKFCFSDITNDFSEFFKTMNNIGSDTFQRVFSDETTDMLVSLIAEKAINTDYSDVKKHNYQKHNNLFTTLFFFIKMPDGDIIRLSACGDI